MKIHNTRNKSTKSKRTLKTKFPPINVFGCQYFRLTSASVQQGATISALHYLLIVFKLFINLSKSLNGVPIAGIGRNGAVFEVELDALVLSKKCCLPRGRHSLSTPLSRQVVLCIETYCLEF
jgi:hypothetical protein